MCDVKIIKRQILCFVIMAMLCVSGCSNKDKKDETPKVVTHEYEVMSVFQYVKTDTNGFGGVTDQNLAYCFTYIDDDSGQLKQYDDFGAYYGEVRIGDENKYVESERDGIHNEYLYLTSDTLKEMNKK